MNGKSIPMWSKLSEELEFAYAQCGTYVVAVGEEEFAGLDALRAQGDANGIPTEIISGEEMRKREPTLGEDISGALYCPVGGICDPWGATIAAAENAVMNGVTLKLKRPSRISSGTRAAINRASPVSAPIKVTSPRAGLSTPPGLTLIL